MMYSVPDTPFGKALGQFLRLFEQRPLALTRLYAAYADLAALAARDHPDMPWPMKLNQGDGRNTTFTVEELLRTMRNSYTNQPAVDAATVADKLMAWHGAKVQNFAACGGPNPYLRLNLSHRISNGPRKFRTEPLGTLAADCAWKLLQEQKLLGASTETGPRGGTVLSKALKGATVLTARLESGGVLVMTFSGSVVLEVTPDAFSIKADYLLILAEYIYSHFDGGFTAEKLNFIEDSDPVADKPTA